MNKLKCIYCGSSNLKEEPQYGLKTEEVEAYGDCQHRCLDCGAVGHEVFGHGIRWEKKE